MIADTLETFTLTIPFPGRLLGLDIGDRKIGVALSDSSRVVASPLMVLQRENISKDHGRLKAMIKEHAIVGIVIGLPKTMDGNEGESCTKVRVFTEKLLKKVYVPTFFQDERLSTAAVMRSLNETDYTRKKKETMDDKMAASYILQIVLDRIAYTSPKI